MKITGISERSEPTPKRLNAMEKRLVSIQQQLEEQFLTIAFTLTAIEKTRKDGILLAQQLVSLVDHHIALAKKYEQYLEFLERVLGTSVILSAIMGHAIFASMIASNHGFNVLALLGFKPKEVPPEQREPELSEENRAMIFMNLMARQETFKAQLNEGDVS